MTTTAIGTHDRTLDFASIRSGDQCSSELEPTEARAMLSELSGTPLRAGEAWDDEARGRFADFQRSEGLPATGELDDVSVARLTLRFQQVADARHAHAAEGTLAAPDAAARERATHMIAEVVHDAEHLAHQMGAHGHVGGRYLREAREWATSLERGFAEGAISEGEVARATSTFRNAMSTSARVTENAASAAIAQALREEGASLGVLLDRYAGEAFSKPFAELSSAEQGSVYMRLAERAGLRSQWLGSAVDVAPKVGKALFVVSVAVAIVQVAQAEDKVREGVKQTAILAGGAAGAELGAAVGASLGPPGALVGALIFGIAGAILAGQAAERTYDAIRG